jgi:dsDNA-specific endonuclease/ATPase MutS2
MKEEFTMRHMKFEELAERAKGQSRMLINEMNRQCKVRRRPRSPQETEILGEIMVQRVEKAREMGRVKKVGDKLTIRLE